MSEVELRVGAKINLLNQDELDSTLSRYMEPVGSLRATDGIHLPVLFKTGSSPFVMGGDSVPNPQGPASGYVWSVRRIAVEGLATGATPDVLQVFSRNRLVAQVTGALPVAFIGRGEAVIRSGETLEYRSLGTFAATGQIIASGFAQQVPQELEGRFYV